MSEFCANPACGKELPADIRQRRHRTQDDLRPITCNRDCDIERRRLTGIYKAMSAAGSAARSRAVAVSNQEHPRRRRRENS